MLDIISSEEIYRGRVLNLRVDRVELSDGGSAPWEIVVHNGGVAMLPIDEEENVHLVRQYRHAVEELLLEIPAGTVEPAEPADKTAARELREEIGMQAGSLQLMGRFFLAPGYSSELMHLFLATDLLSAPLPKDADEDIEVVKLPFVELLAMIGRNEIRDSKTLLAALLYSSQRDQI